MHDFTGFCPDHCNTHIACLLTGIPALSFNTDTVGLNLIPQILTVLDVRDVSSQKAKFLAAVITSKSQWLKISSLYFSLMLHVHCKVSWGSLLTRVFKGSSLTKWPPPPTLKVSQEQGGERQSTHPAIYHSSQEGHITSHPICIVHDKFMAPLALRGTWPWDPTRMTTHGD